MIRFIKWWWAKNDEFNRTFFIGVPLTVVSFIISVWLPKEIGLYVAFGPAALIAIFWLIYLAISVAKSEWNTYKQECPTEDEVIINRLKGSGPGSYEKDNV